MEQEASKRGLRVPTKEALLNTESPPDWLHDGQLSAWNARERIILVLAGAQSGKTVLGPHWLLREIQRHGPGEYGVISPTFSLMEKKALPELRKVFGDSGYALGRYVSSPVRKFDFSPVGAARVFGDPKATCTIHFGYAEDPESLESATYKAVWCDEPGQKSFKLQSYEAIMRRLSIASRKPNGGRLLLTTTPYDLGWLKSKLHDPALQGSEIIRLVRFDSLANPVFPKEEYERARRDLPKWKFDLYYRALYTKPAGAIYDCFEDSMVVDKIDLRGNFRHYLGMDFGQVNTAAVFISEDRLTGKLYIRRIYHKGGRSAARHAEELLRGEKEIPIAVGGATSEDEWRREFSSAGLPVRRPPIKDVEKGLDYVYGEFRAGRLLVFNDPELETIIDDLRNYSRELDDAGDVTEKIADKEKYHLLDALRYVISFIVLSRASITVDAVYEL